MLKDEGLAEADRGKGLHLMATLRRRIDHDETRAYTKQIAHRLAATAPDRYAISSAPGKRAGRIFIDYLRNGARRPSGLARTGHASERSSAR
jgi:bifunctional non-homologous end joining protein LigD